jgi:hypothetical protein
MHKISLSGKIGKDKFALVSDEDFGMLNQYTWAMNKSGYAITSFYKYLGKKSYKRYKVLMHKMIMNPKNKEVDHINHEPLDNQRENLRLVSSLQNKWNTRKHKNCSSIFKGVYFYKHIQKYWAYIKYNGKRISLGYFKDENEAGKAYDIAAKQFFGKYSHLNFK